MNTIEVRWGAIKLRKLVFGLPRGVNGRIKKMAVELDGKTLKAEVVAKQNEARICLGGKVMVAQGKKLRVVLMW